METTSVQRTFNRHSSIGCSGSPLLSSGEAEFEVLSLDWTKSERFDCEAARIRFRIRNQAGAKTIAKTFLLGEQSRWMIVDLFKAVGLVEANAKEFVPEWNSLIGRKGLCIIQTEPWSGRDGYQHHSNGIKKFLLPQATAKASSVAEPRAEAARSVPAAQQKPPDDDIPF